MANRAGPDCFYHLGRDTLSSDKETHRKNRQRPNNKASYATQRFVPGFNVRRRVLATPDAKQLVRDLREILPGNYSVLGAGGMALTILEQKRLVKRFRKAEVQPHPDDMKRVATETAHELGKSLDGVPRRLTVPTGLVDHFGKEGKEHKLGVKLGGWLGFSAQYEERGPNKSISPFPVIVRETDLCMSGLINAFGSNEELEEGILLDGTEGTPHITFAQKDKGGPISDSELAGFACAIEEILPEELQLFDPTVFMKLEPGNGTVLHARAPQMSRHGPDLPGELESAA